MLNYSTHLEWRDTNQKSWVICWPSNIDWKFVSSPYFFNIISRTLTRFNILMAIHIFNIREQFVLWVVLPPPWLYAYHLSFLEFLPFWMSVSFLLPSCIDTWFNKLRLFAKWCMPIATVSSADVFFEHCEEGYFAKGMEPNSSFITLEIEVWTIDL